MGPTGQPWAETWLVREWCGHGCLTDAIMKGWLQTKADRRSEVNFPAVLATAAEIASALTLLHKENLLHGDLTGDWCVPCEFLAVCLTDVGHVDARAC